MPTSIHVNASCTERARHKDLLARWFSNNAREQLIQSQSKLTMLVHVSGSGIPRVEPGCVMVSFTNTTQYCRTPSQESGFLLLLGHFSALFYRFARCLFEQIPKVILCVHWYFLWRPIINQPSQRSFVSNIKHKMSTNGPESFLLYNTCTCM